MKITLITLVLLFSHAMFGQTTYAEAEKQLQKDKTVKMAKKEAKKWQKQGYTNLPGNLPLPSQFEKSLVMQVIRSENGDERYISATGSAIAGSEGVAQANALDNTRLLLAGLIQAQVSGLVTSNKGSTAYTADQVATIDEFISNSKTLIQGEIGYIKPVIEMMRRNDDKFEYRFTVMYDAIQAKEMTRKLLQDKLRDKLDTNEAELNKLLGL